MPEPHVEATRAVVYWAERAHLHLRELADVVRVAAAAEVRAIEAQAALADAPRDDARILQARLRLKDGELDTVNRRLSEAQAACTQHKIDALAAGTQRDHLIAALGASDHDEALARAKACAALAGDDATRRLAEVEAACTQHQRRADAAERERAELLAALGVTSFSEGLARARSRKLSPPPAEAARPAPRVLRKPVPQDSQRAAECIMCGASFPAPAAGRPPTTCAICKVTRRKHGDLACRTCVAGLPNAASEVGYECVALKARECLPTSFAYWHTPDETAP